MLLRRFTEADAGPLAVLYGDPRVMRFITPQPPALADVKTTILPEYLREYRELAEGIPTMSGGEVTVDFNRPGHGIDLAPNLLKRPDAVVRMSKL